MDHTEDEGRSTPQPPEEALEDQPNVGLMSEEAPLERLYTIPLRHAWVAPRKRRSARAVRLVKEFVQRHLKADRIVITNEVNEAIWRRGVERPPRRIKVRVVMEETDEGSVATVYLAE